jgi:hypothetical protein
MIERIFIFIVEAIVGMGFIVFIVGGMEAMTEVIKVCSKKGVKDDGI